MATRSRYRFSTVATIVVIIAVFISGAWLLAHNRGVKGSSILPGGVVRVIAGRPGEELNTPLDVAVAPNGQTYVADAGNGRVQVFSRWGRPKGFLGEGKESFVYPNTVAVDAYGRVYVGDFTIGQIKVFTARGKLLRTLDAKTVGAQIAPLDMAVGSDGCLLVADRRGAVMVLDSEGRLRKRFDRIEGASPETLSYPNGIAEDSSGRILVADSANRRLLLTNADGKLIRVITNGKLTHPRGVAFFGEKYIITADTFNNRLLVFDLKGKLVKTLRAEDQPGLAYMMPNGLCVYQNRVYVADRADNVVLVFGKEAD
mgnify:CR=1 FL=1